MPLIALFNSRIATRSRLREIARAKALAISAARCGSRSSALILMKFVV